MGIFIKNILLCLLLILPGQVVAFILLEYGYFRSLGGFLPLVVGGLVSALTIVWMLLRKNNVALDLLHHYIFRMMVRIRTKPEYGQAEPLAFSPQDLQRMSAASSAKLSEIGYWVQGIDSQLAESYQTIAGQFQQYEKMLDKLPLPVIMFDEDYHIVQQNRFAESIFGTEALGRLLLDILPDPNLPEHLQGVMKHRRSLICRDVSFESTPVRYFSAALSPMPKVAQAGEHADEGINLLRNPYAETYAKRGVMILMEETAQRWAAERGVDFVANVSHELRTPLTNIQGYLDLLKDSDLPKKDRKEGMKVIRKQTKRMARLVEDLLTLANLDEPNSKPLKYLVDMTKVIQQEAALIKRRLKDGAHHLTLAIPDETIWVLGDDGQLAQIVQNLLDNALKYSRPKSEITVRLETVPIAMLSSETQKQVRHFDSAQAVRLEIIDQGMGIAEQHLPHLTTRFYRVDRDRSRESGGTGLGLAIVKHIVQNHQGVFTISSELGVGSRFSILLPNLDVEAN